mmetsp:Transcript_12492/g.34460  ORF Transcript_12492/g.34460 Transcript_12492/m.34460 type:complete len:282 (+) Transcript_12492:1130-1975(+)
MSSTTRAFCFGDALQHITERQDRANFRNLLDKSWSSNTKPSAAPVMVRVCCPPYGMYRALEFSTSRTSVGPPSNMMFSILSVRRRQALPILRAVSSLSPVSIQIAIPAEHRCWMVSGTPSCKRSSMPVAPNNLSPGFVSISHTSLSTRIWRSSVTVALACSYLSCQSAYSAGEISLQPKQSVLNPCMANFRRCSSIFLAPRSSTCGNTELSAPFSKSATQPFGYRTTTDILFRSLSNSHKSSTSMCNVRGVTPQPGSPHDPQTAARTDSKRSSVTYSVRLL